MARTVGLTNGDYTVEFWAKPGTTQHTDAALLDSHTGGSGWTFAQDGTATNTYYWAVFTPNGLVRTSGVKIAPQLFHHVAVTYNSVSHVLSLYVDGFLATSQGGFVSPATPQGNMYFGRAASGGHYWHGMLHYVRFSNIVRYFPDASASVAQPPMTGYAPGPARAGKGFNIFLSVLGFPAPQGPFDADASTLAVWNLDAGIGTVVYDLSTAHLAGTFEGQFELPEWVDSSAPVLDALLDIPATVAAAPPPPVQVSAGSVAPTPSLYRPQVASQPPIAYQPPALLPQTGGGGTAGLIKPALLFLVLLVVTAGVLMTVHQRKLQDQ